MARGMHAHCMHTLITATCGTLLSFFGLLVINHLRPVGIGSYCPIDEVPFRGVNCSDAAGGERHYSR